MNKLTIPVILVATVMVAGAFAFMPVEQASTVHTTIIDSVANVVAVSPTDCTMIAAPDGGTSTDCDELKVTIPVGTDGILLSVLVDFTDSASASASTDFGLLTVNGAVTTVDPATTGSTATVSVSGENWGIEGAGASTITATNTNTVPVTATQTATIAITLFMLVDGADIGISATLD